MSRPKNIRGRFYRALLQAIPVVWPVFLVLMGAMAAMGCIVGFIEAWHPMEGLYFAFVTGLTVGYGDLVPHHPFSRVLAICIGFTGVLLTALFAAIGVRALEVAVRQSAEATGQHTHETHLK